MKKILIVEDDLASQLMLEIMIEDFCKFPFVAYTIFKDHS
jgi:hypothetical protein